MKTKTLRELNIPHDLPGRRWREKNGAEALREVGFSVVLLIFIAITCFALLRAGYDLRNVNVNVMDYRRGAAETNLYYEATGQMPPPAWVEWRLSNLEIDINTTEDITNSLKTLKTTK